MLLVTAPSIASCSFPLLVFKRFVIPSRLEITSWSTAHGRANDAASDDDQESRRRNLVAADTYATSTGAVATEKKNDLVVNELIALRDWCVLQSYAYNLQLTTSAVHLLY
jgi:hypothetical protein